MSVGLSPGLFHMPNVFFVFVPLCVLFFHRHVFVFLKLLNLNSVQVKTKTVVSFFIAPVEK